MKKITLTLLAMVWLGSAAYAQAVPKTKTKNRDQQGVIMTDTPNTIAPTPPADRNNNTAPGTNPQRTSQDTQPLNRNSSGEQEKSSDMNRSRSDINRNTNDILNNPATPPAPPPMSK